MKKSRTAIIATLISTLLPLGAVGSGWISDPSTTAIRKDDLHCGERFRMLADFNADGIQDMALSSDIKHFGNAGGTFTLYIGNAKGEYREHSTFFAQIMAVSLETHGNETRLWIYSRGGGSVGRIGYRVVLKDRLSEYHSIEIHPGDSGTAMGNAIYKAVFQNSALPIKAERSVTKNGTVRWIDPDNPPKEIE